jgi:lysylphosphatidylglycerol synthetase-like protein (DUF2156 family)
MQINTDVPDIVALVMMITVVTFLIYLVIYIHDIPYEIAKKRNHPHRDAIHIAGWVSLFLLHVIWPFLWIWAYLYTPGEGWGMETIEIKNSPAQDKELEELRTRLSALEMKLSEMNESIDNPDTKEIREVL